MKKTNYILDAWLVLVLSLLFGAGLAWVQSALKDRIEQNKLADALGQISKLVPGSEKGERREIGGIKVFAALDAQGQVVGWALPARGQGFADIVAILIGLDAKAEKITGIYVLEQKETPGLGDFITDGPKFRDQFAGKPATAPLKVVKTMASGDNEIQAITGATISSDSVVGILNGAIADFRKNLPQGGATANP